MTTEVPPSVTTDDRGPRWLHSALGRELTPLEQKIAAWAQRSYRGIYHLDESTGWQRWMKKPSDHTHEVTTNVMPATPGYGSAWGNLAAWVEVAADVGLRFHLRAAAPGRIAIRFWHEDGRP